MKAYAPVGGQGPTLEFAQVDRHLSDSSFPSERQVLPDQDGKESAGDAGRRTSITELAAGVLGARMEGGGHRFPSRLLVPSLFPPFLHLHHLPENLQVPRESPIKSAAAGGGGGRCSLSTPGSQQALQSGCTEAGRAGSPGGRGGKVSGIEACSPGDSKTHLQGLLPTDSHLPADAFDQIGTRPGPDRDRIRLWEGLSVALPPHHSMDRLPAALFLLSHVPTETPSGLSRPVLQVQVCGSVFKAPPADADHPRPTPLPTHCFGFVFI